MADRISLALQLAKAELTRAHDMISDDVRSYPTPISGCDAQFNHLLAERARIHAALAALQDSYFIPSPRRPTPAAKVESR